VAEITALAADLGYSISGSNKAEKITSFLDAQTTANA